MTRIPTAMQPEEAEHVEVRASQTERKLSGLHALSRPVRPAYRLKGVSILIPPDMTSRRRTSSTPLFAERCCTELRSESFCDVMCPWPGRHAHGRPSLHQIQQVSKGHGSDQCRLTATRSPSRSKPVFSHSDAHQQQPAPRRIQALSLIHISE